MKADWKRPSSEKIKELADNLKKAVDQHVEDATVRAKRLLEMKQTIKSKGKIEQWKRERDGK